MRRFTSTTPILFGLLAVALAASPVALADLLQGAPEPGEEGKVEGIVTATGPGVFTVVNKWDREIRVVYNEGTEFEERKRNFFREARTYSPDDLGVGLEVTVEGRGDSAGNLEAESVKFTQDALRLSESLRTRVEPVEAELEATRSQLAGVESDLKATSEQMGAEVSELRSGIRAADERADEAFEHAQVALETGREALDRIGNLDDYREVGVLRVGFDLNSSELSDDARQELDSLIEDVELDSGYLLEVSGFASSDGNEAHNRRLSQQRANRVIRYLVEEHELPRRRILAPYGYGENKPLGDNSVLEGRRENRRVEVRVLINMGIGSTRQPAG